MQASKIGWREAADVVGLLVAAHIAGGNVAEDVKLCECGCGQPAPIATRTSRRTGLITRRAYRFISGHHLKRLAAARRVDLTNQVFGRITVIRCTDARRDRWEVKCECGSVLDVTGSRLRSGKVTSCGRAMCIVLESEAASQNNGH